MAEYTFSRENHRLSLKSFLRQIGKQKYPPMDEKEHSMTLQQSVEHQRLSGLDEFVYSIMQATKVPGLALAVVKGDEVILAQGFGKRNVAEDLSVTSQTLFA